MRLAARALWSEGSKDNVGGAINCALLLENVCLRGRWPSRTERLVRSDRIVTVDNVSAFAMVELAEAAVFAREANTSGVSSVTRIVSLTSMSAHTHTT